MKTYDVLVIGAGPGGYVAAIRCAQLGLETACVDAWIGPKGRPALGGTCLNVGCIPSKALLDTSHRYHDLAHLLPKHGITVEGAAIDIAAMQARRAKVVANLTRGIAGLFKKNGVVSIPGRARLLPDRRVEITPHGSGAKEVVGARHTVIATGSAPVEIGAAPVDGEAIVDSAGALTFAEVPPRLGIIGAGVIGLELGSVWSRLGSQVTMLEALDEFLVPVDREVAQAAFKAFTRQGLEIRLGTLVEETRREGSGVAVGYRTGDETRTLEVDKLVVAVGRRPVTEGLDPEAAGVRLDPQGRIEVDAEGRTAVEGVYAVGDVVRGPMLAHKASEEGVAVAEMIAGQSGHVDLTTIPWVVYTHPEIAWVGRTEAELARDAVPFRAGSFPYLANGRAQGAGDTEGFVKILGHAETDEILGVHIFGAQASELIAEAVTAMAFNASSEDLARTVHAHPTLSEIMHEAALAVDGRALHI